MASDRIVERRRDLPRSTRRTSRSAGSRSSRTRCSTTRSCRSSSSCVIIGLAIVWKYSTPGDHTTGEAGWLGKLYDAPADPGTINFVPRPDWYFYFLFYLLRIFKWPPTVILGTIGIPTIALVLLLAIPFIDIRAGAAAQQTPGRDHRLDPRRHLDGRAHLQGRDREGVARLGADRRRCRRGRRSRASPTTSRRSPARSCSRSPAVSTATRTSASAAGSRARPS